MHDVFSGRAFKIHAEKKSWEEARKICQSEGGDLVTIDEPEINSWIAREGQMSLGPLWIGATDVVN